MGILSKARGLWYRERLKSIIRRVETQNEPLFYLGAAVGTAALGCADALKAEINPEEHPDTWVLVAQSLSSTSSCTL